MKEQFDKKLVGKIIDSFSKHDEPFDPKQWEKLSAAYFKPRKPIWKAYWPLITTGIAASLLLILFFSPFNIDRKSPQTNISQNSSQTENGGMQEDRHPADSSIALLEKSPPIVSKSDDVVRSLPKFKQNQKELAETKNSEAIAAVLPHVNQEMPPTVLRQQFHIELPLDEIDPSGTEGISSEASPRPSSTMEQSEALTRVNDWLAESGANLPITSKKERVGPLKLGVMVSPQASSNATGGMNLGAGVMSEFSLTKRLKLDVGVNYARQSIMPDRSPNMASEMATYASFSQKQDMQNIRTSSNFIGSELHLNFASLDIPVNLKYRILDRKNTGLFLITGLSSMVYLDQQATETFQTNSFFTSSAEGLSFAPSVQSFTSVYSPEGGSNSVDVGGMLNLSVGYEYNLSDGMFISFEPFYKLPLGTLTFANQQFSIGGLNLRMNFNLGK